MAEAKARSFSITAKFVVFDPIMISPNKANILIKKMRQAVKDFKLRTGYITAYVLNMDEFEVHEMNANMLFGSWLLRIESVDENSDNGAVMRFNQFNDCGFEKALTELVFTRYQTIIRMVLDQNNPGELVVANAMAEPSNIRPGTATMGEQKYSFYERFSKSVADYPFLARVLILEKEFIRLGRDIALTDEARKALTGKVSKSINSLKQNMKPAEIEELVYLSASLDLIPTI